MSDKSAHVAAPRLIFADVFAGCGGLSLGLIQAGWSGLFAIEKDATAFETLRHNLVDGRTGSFAWPEWLPQEAIATSEFLEKYRENLTAMKGKVSLLAGGPPCQGFSMAGRRTHSDPRNALVDDYITIVRLLEPRFLVIENVQGFTLPFKKNIDRGTSEEPYSILVKKRLTKLGYKVFTEMVNLSDYGVPQNRKRFILIGIRKGDDVLKLLGKDSPFDRLRVRRQAFLRERKLPINRAVTAREAIGDLEVKGKELVENEDYPVRGATFKQIKYEANVFVSTFIKLMRKGTTEPPDSLRLSNHRSTTITQFRKISSTCTPGKTITDQDRKRLGLKKHAITPLSADMPSATVTTLPDDIIHYSEPRILTVRENARLQTFPDWFRFLGLYTTGQKQRKDSCPRYTQIGNAVPPLFAEALGRMLSDLADSQLSTAADD